MMKLLSFFLLLAVLFSADAANFRRLRGEDSVNNNYLGLASEADETVYQRTRQLKQDMNMDMDKDKEMVKPENEAPEPDMSMSLSMSMSMHM
jgi:hypothetical protein